jgi:hypothetical protein
MVKSTPISHILKKQEDYEPPPEQSVETINDVLNSLTDDYDEEDDEEEEVKVREPFVPQEQQDVVQHWLKSQADDIKNSLIVFAIFLIVSKIPLEKIIYKYISLQHIPLSDIIIKGVIAAVLFFVARKFL